MARGYRNVRGECVKLYSDWLNQTEASAVCRVDDAHLYHFKSMTSDSLVFNDLFALSDTCE